MKYSSFVMFSWLSWLSKAAAAPEGAIGVDDHQEEESGLFGNFFGGHKDTFSQLQGDFPALGAGTIERFFTSFGKGAGKKLSAYQQWKTNRDIPLASGDDVTDWENAITESFTKLSVPGELRGSPSTAIAGQVPLKQVVFEQKNAVDKEGHTVLQMLPERMDLTLDHGSELYSDAFCVYMEIKMSTMPEDTKVSLMIDTRTGRGWPNPQLSSIVSAVKTIANDNANLHPERLHNIIVVPVPSFADKAWLLIKPFLPQSLKKHTILVPGESGGLHGKITKENLLPYLSEAVVDMLESNRRWLALGEK